MLKRIWLHTIGFVILGSCSAQGQSERVFSVPLDDLKTWSEKVVIPVKAKITGHSSVHGVASDCEMHMGATLVGYKGDPVGWVLEPMNLCLEVMPDQEIKKTSDWEVLGDTLVGKTVDASGVPRIWPEHLKVDPRHKDSNPAHATEVHPLVTLSSGPKSFDFGPFVFAPEGFSGIKPRTAQAILTTTRVHVREQSGMVEITFESSQIGNFAELQVTVDRDSIKDIDGSHAMDGTAVAASEEPSDVHLITVTGSAVNDTIASAKKGKKKHVTFDSLVLFSLNPETLFAAAKNSHGKEVEVETPIQLIVYGPQQAQ